MKERWRVIVGYEQHYQVSDRGRVRARRREICTTRGICKIWPQKIMRQYEHWKGHMTIFLRKPGQQKKKFFVHRLVAVAFIPNPKDLPLVNHKDMNKQNNVIANLEWATESENTQHYYDNRQRAEPGADLPF